MIVNFCRRSPKIGFLHRRSRKLQKGESRNHPTTTAGGLVMFGRHKQVDLPDADTVRARGWPRSERARQRDRERADAEMISILRWQWRSACAATSLSQVIYAPSGTSRAVPMIGQVDLGPPISFTVRMRPGQTLDDFTAAAPSIAPAMNAAALQITPFVAQWLRVVLLPARAVVLPNRWSDSNVEVLNYA